MRPHSTPLSTSAWLALFSYVFSVSAMAQNAEPFPTPSSKKGLQVQMVDDAIVLGIRHATLNVSLGALFHLEEKPGATKYLHEGRPFWLNTNYVRSLDADVKPLSDAGIVIYLIVLAYPTKDAAKDAVLLHPKRREDGKFNIAAFNTATEEGTRLYRALIAFLAERYSGAHPEAGRVWGWIIGNEVNSQWLWYNMGRAPLAEVCSEYERAVRAAHEEVSRHVPHARCYLSFDHHWKTAMPGISDQEAYRTKDFLDTFAKLARERGDFAWHVAHHPYPDNLGNPRTWEDKAAWTTDDSPHITFKNLEVACRAMLKPELLWQGKPRRIILSEQGIHCLDKPEGEHLQAAGFVYAWEKVQRQPGIDAMIWHRHVDHAHEGGLRLGLWTLKPGSVNTPEQKRLIYGLFQKADTAAWSAQAAEFLRVVGLSSWDELTK
ncbi:MAG: DUF5722 domain-containing protein [Roseimicrobium sp.]